MKHVWVYVYIMNGGCSDFLMYVAFIYSLCSERFTMRQDLLFFSSTSHKVSQERLNMAPSGAIIYLLFVPNIISLLFVFQHRKNARVSSCF
jgi:hypothetical protein